MHGRQADGTRGTNDLASESGAALALGVSSTPRESVELLDGGAQAYPAMLSAIAQARASVDLEVYCFASTGIGARFVEALANAAGRGVAVRVVIDGWGSARRGRAVAAALREAGCVVRIHHRLLGLLVGRFGRNHRKLLLVDDEVAFLGGINIGDENLSRVGHTSWADLALTIRGPECVRLGAMMRHVPGGLVQGSVNIRLCGLGGGWRLRKRYLAAFASARSRIHVAHGYFLPDRGVVRAITKAAKRADQVQLLLAGQSDIPLAQAATRSLYRQLLVAGVAIYEWNESVLHAKVTTVDGKRLLLGSFNLDPFSLVNLEALVEIDNDAVVAQVEEWIQRRMVRSRMITHPETTSRARQWFLDPFGCIVARLAAVFSSILVSRRRRRGSPDYSEGEHERRNERREERTDQR